MAINIKDTLENTVALLEVFGEKIGTSVNTMATEACDALDMEVSLKKLQNEHKRKVYELGEACLASPYEGIPADELDAVRKVETEIKSLKERIAEAKTKK